MQENTTTGMETQVISAHFAIDTIIMSIFINFLQGTLL